MSRCIRCKRPATRQTVIDVNVGPQDFCSALCEQLWGQAAAEREGWRNGLKAITEKRYTTKGDYVR